MTNQWQPPYQPGAPGFTPPGQFPGMAQPGAQPQGPGPMQPQVYQPGFTPPQQPAQPQPAQYGPPQGYTPQPQGYAPQQAPQLRVPSLNGVRAGNTNGRYLPPGEYVVDIDRALVTQAQDGRGTYFVVEFTIVESDNAAVQVGDSTYSWARGFQDQYGYGPRDIKGWICEVVESKMPGSNPREQWDDGFIGWIASEGENPNHPQPSRGTRMRVSAFEKPNKRKVGSTTIINWTAVPPGTIVGLQATHSTAPAPVAQQAPQGQYTRAPQGQPMAAPQAPMVPNQANAYAQPPGQWQPQGQPPQGFAPPPGMAPGVWPGPQGGQR